MDDFYVYAGLAGDTDTGRFWSAGLYRSRNGTGAWESLADRFPGPPQTFAILIDPARPEQVTAGTRDGIWRSADHGDSWRRLDAPEPELGVWSLAHHPGRADVILAGYEPCAVLTSPDNGDTWRNLKVAAGFPSVSDHPDIPKRAISIAADRSNADEIYVAVEVGGLLRSLDGGRSWKNVIDGLYIDEGSVDIHSVVIHPERPGQLTIATRCGVFRSDDRGEHWRDLKVPPTRPVGSYCRVLRYAPDDGKTLYLAAANDFDGDRGVLYISRDDGASWAAAELGRAVRTPMFGLAVDHGRPDNVFCISKIGQLFGSTDRGRSWTSLSLPPGAGHVFTLAAG